MRPCHRKGHGLKVDLGDANEVGAVFLVVVVEVGLVLEVVRVEAAVRQGDVWAARSR